MSVRRQQLKRTGLKFSHSNFTKLQLAELFFRMVQAHFVLIQMLPNLGFGEETDLGPVAFKKSSYHMSLRPFVT